MKFNSPTEALLQLGLTGPATREDVKSAYRERLKVYHPDAHPEPAVAWQYYDIVDAYEYLMALYDALETGGRNGILPKAPSQKAAESDGFSGRTAGERAAGGRAASAASEGRNARSAGTTGRTTGGRILGDTEAARESKQRSAWRARSRKTETERRQEKLAELEERRQQAAFEDAMNRIHAERAAEVSAQIISAILRGDKPADD